jgi:sialate O-acetylesterase
LIFPTLVKSWRKAWNRPELAFYFAQLSSLSRPSWPSFRNSQLNMAKTIPYSGMVVTSDLGDSLDVHPIRKKEVGHRFALLALHNTYHKIVIASGPVIKSAKQDKNNVILNFSNALKLKTADSKSLREFEISGSDRIFHPVDASINLDKVVISIPSSQVVTAVRYGWKPYSRGNLVNEAGLPASTFEFEILKNK